MVVKQLKEHEMLSLYSPFTHLIVNLIRMYSNLTDKVKQLNWSIAMPQKAHALMHSNGHRLFQLDVYHFPLFPVPLMKFVYLRISQHGFVDHQMIIHIPIYNSNLLPGGWYGHSFSKY